MATVKLHSPAEGKNALETVTVSADRADWLVALGYATHVDGEPEDHTLTTAPVASKDPTLAANREKPGEAIPTPNKGVEPVELSGSRTNTDVAKAQAEADEQSEKVREASAEAQVEVVERSNTDVAKAQAEADKTSEKAAKKGDNAAQEPGDATPVTEPAVPAVP